MPALSPTMTEGNIAKWQVKEGDSFSAGDVLLEIETDKASMDVEAQEDGILAKIFQGDGTKGIKVGTRIGVIAESGDDISTLEIPQEESAPTSSPKEEASKPEPSKTSESQAEAPPTSKSSSSTSSDEAPKPKKQTYPLLPSVEHLMHENGLDASEIDKMTPTGPNNRLLKGDVLAYLGRVPASLPAKLEAQFKALSHLDLSNIKLAAPKPAPKAASIPEPEVEEEIDLEVAVPVSMAAVFEVQKRIESTLGVFLPLSTFITRAADFANDDLPRSAGAKQSADELFNAVLGLDKVGGSDLVRGNFMPQIMALPHTAVATMPRQKAAKKQEDVIDFLTGKKTSSRSWRGPSPVPGVAATTNIFSVSVPKEDERRARVFLERVKAVLEEEPGRLVL